MLSPSTPAAWLSLDEADNDPARFLSYLSAALQQVVPAIGQDLRSALETSSAPPADAVIAALINDLMAQQPADFVLVLDDFHAVDDATIDAALRDPGAHGPPQLHVVITTREDPQLPLARLRARGQLLELLGQDLRFSTEEAAVFLRDTTGLTLDSRDLAELDARLEGWAAGRRWPRRRSPICCKWWSMPWRPSGSWRSGRPSRSAFCRAEQTCIAV